jgi:phosphoserine phosphatase
MPHFALLLTARAHADDVAAANDVIAGRLGPGNAPRTDVLAAGRAVQWQFNVPTAGALDLLTAVREAFQHEPVDVNLIACDENRRKRLLLADMDSTIIGQECIDEIAAFAGVGDTVAAITERAMRGELDFEAALTERVGLLRGLDVQALATVARERLTITPGARELVATMRAAGAWCVLVSGGFTYFTSRIAARVGFDQNQANTLEIRDGRLTGNPVLPILGRAAKHEALGDLARARGLPLTATLAVGDGANDLAMIEAAGLGVAFRANPLVAATADARIDHGDLADILFLQGYRADEIVTPA